MDRKERTLRALQGLPVDRPPMVFWHHFVGADMEKENFVDSHVRFYRETVFVKSYHNVPTHHYRRETQNDRHHRFLQNRYY